MGAFKGVMGEFMGEFLVKWVWSRVNVMAVVMAAFMGESTL